MSTFSLQSRSSGGHGRLIGALAAAIIALCAVEACANDPAIVRVEEDWVLEVGAPAFEASAPQVVTVMTPSGNLDGTYAMFEVNHNTMPQYGAGGLQLQRWHGESVLDYHGFPDASILATDNETVSFTSAMSINSGKLWFEILDGSSTTWGNFGGQGYLKTGVETTATEITGYSPATSVKYSRVGFASNRVKRLVLKEVRYYSGSGLVATDTQDRVVYEQSSTTE